MIFISASVGRYMEKWNTLSFYKSNKAQICPEIKNILAKNN